MKLFEIYEDCPLCGLSMNRGARICPSCISVTMQADRLGCLIIFQEAGE